MPDLIPDSFGLAERLGLIAVVAVAAHFAVRIVRLASTWVMALATHRTYAKARTVTGLITSILIFVLYFGALGWALSELGVSLTAYFASASIIGLAVGFGSQGIVQDVMTGMTIVLTDQFDVGDMIQIGDNVGIVQTVGMRFTVLQNAMGAEVLIPNRSIANVINYPRGYVRIHADVTLSADEAQAAAMEEAARAMTASVIEQFAGIFRAPAEVMGRFETTSGRRYLRIKFRIWPGRGVPIETAFKQELMQSLKKIDPDYADWMVAVAYEVEKARPPAAGRKR